MRDAKVLRERRLKRRDGGTQNILGPGQNRRQFDVDFRAVAVNAQSRRRLRDQVWSPGGNRCGWGVSKRPVSA